jgi:hypothetical protein
LTLGYATRKSDNETWRIVEWVECVVLFGESGPNVSVMGECPLVSWFKLPEGGNYLTCARSIRNVSEEGTP